MNCNTVKPFVKWAGGKSQLLNEIRTRYPKKLIDIVNLFSAMVRISITNMFTLRILYKRI